MLIETKPNIKVVKLDGLTADTPVSIPAMHAVLGIYLINRTFKSGGAVVMGVQVANVWKTVVPGVNFSPALSDAGHTININSSDWADVDLDARAILVDLSD